MKYQVWILNTSDPEKWVPAPWQPSDVSTANDLADQLILKPNVIAAAVLPVGDCPTDARIQLPKTGGHAVPRSPGTKP